jgi:hypothetical protein
MDPVPPACIGVPPDQAGDTQSASSSRLKHSRFMARGDSPDVQRGDHVDSRAPPFDLPKGVVVTQAAWASGNARSVARDGRR